MEAKSVVLHDTCDSTKCLLCHETTSELIAVTDGPEVNYVAILGQHFWFCSESIRYQSVCKKCWNCVEEFHRFYMEVERLHKPYRILETQIVEKWEFIEPQTRQQDLYDEAVGIEWQTEKPTEKPDDESTLKISNMEIDEKNRTYISNEPITKELNNSCDPLERTLEEVLDDGDKLISKIRTGKDVFLDMNEGDFIIRQHTELKCPSCDFLASTFTNVKKHMRSIHKTEGYVVCCGLNFSKRIRLLHHVVRIVNPNAFSCEVCNKAFSSHFRLNKHMLKFHNLVEQSTKKDMLKCDQCNLSFDNKSQLNVHLKTHDSNQQIEMLPCSECSKSFPTKARLKDHFQRIHGPDDIVCDRCPKRFKILSQLKVHQKSRHNTDAIDRKKCIICNRWLKGAGGLRKHMLIHQTSDKPNICTLCGKNYPNALALNSHTMFVHRKQRSFECTICEKAFKLARVLEEHMTTHTGNILYTCPYCPKKFNSQANMHAHRKRDHLEEWTKSRMERQKKYESPSSTT